MGKKGTDLFLYLAAGFVGGMALDYVGFAYPDVLGPSNVVTSDPQLTDSDLYQIGGLNLAALMGFMIGSDGLAMAGFSAQLGAIYSKIIAPSYNLPRYLITGSPTGSAVLTPAGTTPATAAKLKTGQAKFGSEVYI